MVKEKNECKTVDGVLCCERVKERPDGTKVVLASVKKRMDAKCNPQTDAMSGEDVALGKLNKFMDDRLSLTCNKTPEDY